MSFTVIAPIFNEEKNVQILFDEILNSCSKIPLTQVIFVNDSSNDESLNQLKNIICNIRMKVMNLFARSH